jgi:hypothetical protein
VHRSTTPFLLATDEAAEVLADDLSRYIDVVRQRLHGAAARLDLTAGERPVLYLDDEAPAQERCQAMLEVRLMVSLGTGVAVTARTVPRLRAVS